MSFYEEMRGVADELLAEFKQGAVILTRIAPGESDPETPWIPGEAVETSYSLDATVRGVSAKYIDGTTVVASDLQIMCAVPPVEPQMTDVYSIDGDVHVPKRILPIPAAGEPCAYLIIVAS